MPAAKLSGIGMILVFGRPKSKPPLYLSWPPINKRVSKGVSLKIIKLLFPIGTVIIKQEPMIVFKPGWIPPEEKFNHENRLQVFILIFTILFIYALVLRWVKSYWIYPTVKYATWCNSCINFVPMCQLLDFSLRAKGIIQTLQLLPYSPVVPQA